MALQTISKAEDILMPTPEAPNVPQVVLALARVLGSTHVLYQKSLFYHWNVKGPHFYGLHKMFEEHYEELHKAGDVLAERIRALGYSAPGTLQDFLELSVVEEDNTLPERTELMIDNLINAHHSCAGAAREALVTASKIEDQVTVDLMIKRITFHDKVAWMLRASLPEKPQDHNYSIEHL